jgi:hypothetical protein
MDKIDFVIAAVALLTIWVATHEWRLFKLEKFSDGASELLWAILESLCGMPGSGWSKSEERTSDRRAA